MTADKIIEQIADYYGLTIKGLSTKLGHKRPDSLYIIRKRKPQRLSERLIKDFLNAFPALNEHFLRTGKDSIIDKSKELLTQNFVDSQISKEVEKRKSTEYESSEIFKEFDKDLRDYVYKTNDIPDKAKLQYFKKWLENEIILKEKYFKAYLEIKKYGKLVSDDLIFIMDAMENKATAFKIVEKYTTKKGESKKKK